ncbi:MAG: DMT family transporter [Beijerinckiaceae bacterium]
MSARVTLLLVASVMAFTANPLLARLAVVTREMDAIGYTGVRLASGALMLLAIILWRRRRANSEAFRIAGTWAGAASLFGYAITYSIAFLVVGAAVGSVILFASVQLGILAWAIVRGDRPGPLEWAGLALAFASLCYLVSPGLVAPDPLGSLLMIASGLSWAAYTLIGRGSRAPVEDTAGNFIRLLPVSVPLIVAGLVVQTPTGLGLVYAIASGAISSGLGYAIWYAVLPSITRSRAAFVQLTVPALAAFGAVIFLSEPITLRLVLSSLGILGGAGLALWAAGLRAGAR